MIIERRPAALRSQELKQTIAYQLGQTLAHPVPQSIRYCFIMVSEMNVTEGASMPVDVAPDAGGSRFVHRLALAVSWLMLLATLAGFGGRFWWVLGLFSPFRFHWLMCCLVCMLVLLMGARWRKWSVRWALAPVMLGVIINGILVAPLWLPVKHPPANGPTLTIMALNLFVGNELLDDGATAKQVAREIERSNATIVVVQEITVHRLGVLAHSLPSYRLVAGTGRPDAFGIALLIKRTAPMTIESATEIDTTGGLTSVKQVELLCRWRGRPLAVLGMHTVSAVHLKSDRFRTAMMSGAAAWTKRQREQGRAVVVTGDFNATPWCAPFRDLKSEGKLVDSQLGYGLQGTWPADLFPLLRIPIDHCLHSEDLITRRREIGKDVFNSDHVPLTVELQWR